MDIGVQRCVLRWFGLCCFSDKLIHGIGHRVEAAATCHGQQCSAIGGPIGDVDRRDGAAEDVSGHLSPECTARAASRHPYSVDLVACVRDEIQTVSKAEHDSFQYSSCKVRAVVLIGNSSE